MIQNRMLKKRIVDISHEHKLSHIGSCITALDIIKEIYDTKKLDEKFVLSSGHSGLALYVVLESIGGYKAEELLLSCGIHPDRLAYRENGDNPIDCSTGSLGQGLPIALGMALADRQKNVYCLISDGELAEGSIWEALMIMNRLNVTNLKIYVNVNGYSAYGRTDPLFIDDMLYQLNLDNIKVVHTSMDQYPEYLQGLKGHYHILNDFQYEELKELLFI